MAKDIVTWINKTEIFWILQLNWVLRIIGRNKWFELLNKLKKFLGNQI
jgi:hypothetical protein